MQRERSSGPRQWGRRLLNSPSPRDTGNLQLHVGQLPLQEIQKRAEGLVHMGLSRKRPDWNRCTKLGHILAINSTLNTITYDREGTCNSLLFPEEWRVWTQRLGPQFVRLLPEETPLPHTPPKTLWSGSQRGLQETHKTTVNKETDLRAQHRGSRQKRPPASFTLREACFHILKAAARRLGFLN